MALSTDDIDALRDDLLAQIEAVNEARAIVRERLVDEVKQAARQNPRWVGLADYVDTWDDEGNRFWVGVRSKEMVSEAFAAEYGSAEYPPAPLLRTQDEQMRTAIAYGEAYLSSRGSRVSL